MHYHSSCKASHGWVPVELSRKEVLIQIISASMTLHINSENTHNIGYVHTKPSGKQGDKMLDVSSESFEWDILLGMVLSFDWGIDFILKTTEIVQNRGTKRANVQAYFLAFNIAIRGQRRYIHLSL